MKKFEFFIALRYFRSKKGNRFISIISVISIVGVAIGVMALIVVLSVMNGFQNTIREKIINTGFHVYLTSYGKASLVYQYDDLIKKIKKQPSVQVATPFFKGQVIIRSTLQRIMGIDFHGIDRKLFREDESFFKTVAITEGTHTLDDPESILIGRELARFLDVKTGDPVEIISPQGGKIKIQGRLAPVMKRYRVTGIFKTGYYEYDLKLAFTSLDSMQVLMDKPGAAWGIGVKIKDIFAAPRLARDLNKAFAFRYQFFTWMDLNRNLFTALKNEKTMMSLIVFLIIIVASFNIASTLIMMITEKKREIAILKTFGAGRRRVTGIFMLFGMFMSVTGLCLGVLSGLLVSWNLGAIFHFIESIINGVLRAFAAGLNIFTYTPAPEKFEILARDVYYLDRLPVEILFSDIWAVCLGALIIALAFSWGPARQATKFKPMEIIRNE